MLKADFYKSLDITQVLLLTVNCFNEIDSPSFFELQFFGFGHDLLRGQAPGVKAQLEADDLGPVTEAGQVGHHGLGVQDGGDANAAPEEKDCMR